MKIKQDGKTITIPGSLILRNRIYHYQRTMKSGVFKRSTQQTDRQEAEKIALEILYPESQSLINVCKGSTKLKDCILREVLRIEQQVSSGNASRANEALRPFYAFFGDADIRFISSAKLLEYAVSRRKKTTLETMTKEINFIMNLLKNNGLNIDKPELSKIRFKPPTYVRAFTREELVRYFNHVGEGLRCVSALALITGARAAELIPSRWSAHTALLKSEINFETGIITIRCAKLKPNERAKIRRIELPQEILDILKAQCEKNKHSKFVFTPNGNINRDFDACLKRAGIPKYNEIGEKLIFHSFRHTYGTQIAQTAVNAFAVKEALGHSKITSTERYISQSNIVPAFDVNFKPNNTSTKNQVPSVKEIKEEIG